VPAPTAAPPCHAPRTSIAFDAFGDVRACYRSLYTYGRVGTATLRELWDGATRAELVSALDRSDLSLGCSHCAWQRKVGTEHLAFARRYDDLTPAEPSTEAARWPEQIEFALSNSCNLQCVQCNGQFSSAIRSQREQLPPLPVVYDHEFFDQLGPFLDRVQVARFTGGEPFLSRTTQQVWDLMLASGNRPRCFLVTNATQWNDRVEETLDRLRFQVTVSLDAIDPEVLAATRVGIDPVAVLANIERYCAAAARSGTQIGLSYCMMTTTWQEFGAIVRYADERDMELDCSVVTDPQRLSLHRLSRDALREVVETLEREDRQLRPTLTRNRDVWVHELERLRATLDGEERSSTLVVTDAENRAFRRAYGDRAVPVPETPMSMLFIKPPRTARAIVSAEPGGRESQDAATSEAVHHLLRTWAGDPNANVMCGRIVDDVVVAGSTSGTGHWLDVNDLVGRPAAACLDHLIDLLGPAGVPVILEQTEARLDQTIVHTLDEVQVEVRVILARRPDLGTGTVTIDTWMARRPSIGDRPKPE